MDQKEDGLRKDEYERIVQIISESIEDDLIDLNLSGKGISIFPSEIRNAKQIRYLNLSYNNLDSLPDAISELHNLEELIIRGNKISSLPKNFNKLQNLRGLYASGNNFKEFPKIICDIHSLEELELSNNRITDLSKDLRMANVGYLALDGNKIYHFPKEILKENNIYGLELYDNPIYNIPLEIFNYQGDCADEVVNYFEAIAIEQVTRLYEVKLLIVGRGQVGKTCLSRKLMNPNYEVTFQEFSTEGIHINKWNLACPYEEIHKDVTVNMWDFGGQEIYHATHQFFLTKRSVYMFVWDARQEEDHVSFDYWLNIITLLSNNSPVIIVQNKVDERTKEIQRSLYKEKFPNIVGFHKTSCVTGHGILPLIDELKSTISDLPHLGDELPNSWLQIRGILEKDERNYLEHNEYLDICKNHGLDDKKAGFLSDYFHDLGIVLHFREDEILQEIVILKTEWGTDAVYKILDNESIVETNGRFTFRDVRDIWNEDKFKNKHLQLLQLMKKFELCFQLKNTKHYIAPALLPTEQPDLVYYSDKRLNTYFWTDEESVIFEYHYTFMPAGIFTRFMVKMHEYIEHDFYWRNGVFLTFDGTTAKIINNPLSRKISIGLKGSNPKEFLTIIRFHINEIHKTLNNPELKEMIPCICTECKSTPRLMEYRTLLNAKRRGIKKIQCHKSFEEVSVNKLLEGIPEKINDEGFGIKKYEVKIFDEGLGIEEIKKGQAELKAGQSRILAGVRRNERFLTQELEGLIKASEKELVNKIQKDVEVTAITEEQTLKLIEVIQRAILDITTKFGVDDPVIEKANELAKVINHEPDFKGKFKLAIPLIPAILKYEKELSWDLKSIFKEIGEDFHQGYIFTKPK